jgi:hypothetical protein
VHYVCLYYTITIQYNTIQYNTIQYITIPGAKHITLERLTEYERIFNTNFYLASFNTFKSWAGLAQSVQRFARGWTVWGSNPGGGRDFPHSFIPALRAYPASYTMGTEFLSPGYGTGVWL